MMRKIFFGAALVLCGFAATVRAEPAAPVTVAALGDSLTQGYGLAPQDGFVAQLQRWLDARDAGAVLINAGVSGDTTAGGAARVGWTLTPDVDAMIVALGGNDMLRGIAPAVARDNLDTILAAAREAGVAVLLVGMPVPGNYGPDYQRDFAAIYPELAARHGVLYAPDFMAGLGAGDDPARAAALMQLDGIHPDAEGVARIVAALGPKVLDLIAQARGE